MGRRGRLVMATVALVVTAGCSAGSDVEIAGTQRAEPDTTDTTDPPASTFPPDTDPDTTPPDTEPDDTLPPDDPNSSTTVVEPPGDADTYPLATEVLVDEVGVKVLEYIPDATARAADAYLEVPEGWQAVAVRSEVTNYAVVPARYFYLDLLLVRSDGTAFPQPYCGGPPWDPDVGGLSLMPGGVAQGISCFLVPSDAVNDVVLSADNYSSSPVRFSLEPDGGTKVAPALPARPALPAPGSSPPGAWKSPMPLATPGSSGDYTVAVTAFSESAPAPEYTVAPPEGWHYVAAELDVTFTGSDVSEAGYTDLFVVGDGGRLYREDFECAYDDEGDIYNPEPGVPQRWSRCFVVPDTEVASLEIAFSAGYSDDLLFLAVR